VKRAKHNGKKEAYKYISIDFGSAERKKSLQVGFEKVEKLFAKQMEVVREEIYGWKGGAIARSFTKSELLGTVQLLCSIPIYTKVYTTPPPT
jgi:hypothetical protein